MNRILELLATGAQRPSPCNCGTDQMGSHLKFASSYVGNLVSPSGAMNAVTRTNRELSIAFGNEDLGLKAYNMAIGDLAALRGILKANEDQTLALVEMFSRGDIDGASRIAHSIGLTEARLISEDGGWLGLLFVIAVALVLAAATPTSHSADPPPRPDSPASVPDDQADDVMSLVGRED